MMPLRQTNFRRATGHRIHLHQMYLRRDHQRRENPQEGEEADPPPSRLCLFGEGHASTFFPSFIPYASPTINPRSNISAIPMIPPVTVRIVCALASATGSIPNTPHASSAEVLPTSL